MSDRAAGARSTVSWPASVLATALFAVAAAASGQDPTKKPDTAPCRGPEYRQFDFWLGEWDVTLPDGKPAGTNRITSILGGCVLHESWTSARGGVEGQSFNTVGPDGRWHKTWVDNGGSLLLLGGGLRDGRMVMSQESTEAGTRKLDEISWERLPSGRVKQHWRSSTDGGRTWKDDFVGIYTRRAGTGGPP